MYRMRVLVAVVAVASIGAGNAVAAPFVNQNRNSGDNCQRVIDRQAAIGTVTTNCDHRIQVDMGL